MRLTCPNCSAQYEVAEEMIPADGRDVQCSNCATTWFQEGRGRSVSDKPARPVRRAARPEPEPEQPAPQPPEPEDEMPAEVHEPAPEPEPEPEPPEAPVEEEAYPSDPPPAPPVAEDEPVETPGVEDAPSEVPAPAAAAAPRRPLADEDTLEILRQERAHEARKRAAERRRRSVPPPDPSMLPSTEAAAVDPAEEEARAAAAAERARMATAASLARSRDALEAEVDYAPAPAPESRDATVSPEPLDDDVSGAIAEALRDVGEPVRDDPGAEDGLSSGPGDLDDDMRRQSRRDLLPDIEEINSSLRPDERALEAAEAEAGGVDASAAANGSSGFRIGFLLVLFLIALAVAAYVFAPQLGNAVPALADTLAGYVEWVNAQRILLENGINSLTASILGES